MLSHYRSGGAAQTAKSCKHNEETIIYWKMLPLFSRPLGE